jgi:protein associated with RNAse G/E
MNNNEKLDKILDDKDYQLNYKNMHLTVDDLVFIKRLFDRQDAAIAEVLAPFYKKFAEVQTDVCDLKIRVYKDHEERLINIEKQLCIKRPRKTIN